MSDTESRFFTAAESARCLGVSKATVLRHMNELPPEEQAQGSYRGKPTRLVTEIGLVHLSILITEAELNHAALDEVKQGTSSAAPSESSAAKRNEANQGELVAELRARIAAQEKELTAKNDQITSLTVALAKAQEATHAAQALHAATAEQLRLLTARAAQEAPEPPQDEPQPERGPDTIPGAESAQEAPSAPTEATAPEITRRATFRERLWNLITGRKEDKLEAERE